MGLLPYGMSRGRALLGRFVKKEDMQALRGYLGILTEEASGMEEEEKNIG